MIKPVVVAVMMLFPIVSNAQGGGHVGRTQQQVSTPDLYRYRVLRGGAAKIIYETLIASEAKEVEVEGCEIPLKSVFGYWMSKSYTCYDRGEAFTRSSRYKCFEKSELKLNLFNRVRDHFHREPNPCSGDGIKKLQN